MHIKRGVELFGLNRFSEVLDYPFSQLQRKIPRLRGTTSQPSGRKTESVQVSENQISYFALLYYVMCILTMHYVS